MMAVIVFLKAPETGRVKTRLSGVLDPAALLDLYRAFIGDTLEALETAGKVFICFSPPEAKEGLRSWLGEGYDYLPQQGADLGERMSNAFEEIFNRGYSSALLIGTDIPELTRDHMAEARQALSTTDAVIGPTGDGGYYLIGFQKPAFSNAVFHGIPWSTTSVLDQTLKAMTQASLQYKLLSRLEDIDTPEDLNALILRLKTGKSAGKRTLKMLNAYED